MTDGELIAQAGRALFGEHYKAPLAAALGVRTDTVDSWAKGRNAPPPGVWHELHELVGKAAVALDLVAAELAARERRA